MLFAIAKKILNFWSLCTGHSSDPLIVAKGTGATQGKACGAYERGQRCLHSLAVRSLWYFVSCKAHRVQKLTYLIFPRFLHLATQTLRQFVCTNLCESTFPDAVAA